MSAKRGASDNDLAKSLTEDGLFAGTVGSDLLLSRDLDGADSPHSSSGSDISASFALDGPGSGAFSRIDNFSTGSPSSRGAGSSDGSSPIDPAGKSSGDSSPVEIVRDMGNESAVRVEAEEIVSDAGKASAAGAQAEFAELAPEDVDSHDKEQELDEEKLAHLILNAIDDSDVPRLRELVKSEYFNSNLKIEYGEELLSWIAMVTRICKNYNRSSDEVSKVLEVFIARHIADLAKSQNCDGLRQFEIDLITELVYNTALFSDERSLRFMRNVDNFCLDGQKKVLILAEIIFQKVEKLLKYDCTGVEHLHEIKDKYPRYFGLPFINLIGGVLKSLDSKVVPEALLDERFYDLFAQNTNDLKVEIIRSLAKINPGALSQIIERFSDDFLSVDFGDPDIDFAFFALVLDAPEVLTVLGKVGGLDADRRYRDNKTSLLHVAAIKSPNCARYLADKYPQLLSVTDEGGRYPLQNCFLKNDVDTLEYLFKRSPEDARDQIRYTSSECYNIALTQGLFDVCGFLFKNNHPPILDDSDIVTPLELVLNSDLSAIYDPNKLDQIRKWNSFIVNCSEEYLMRAPEEERKAIIGKIEARDGDRESCVLLKMIEYNLFEHFSQLVDLGFDINKARVGVKTAADFLVEKYQELEVEEGSIDDLNRLEGVITTMKFFRVEGFDFDKIIKLSGGREVSFHDIMKKSLYQEMADPMTSGNFPSELRGGGNIAMKMRDAAMGVNNRRKHERELKGSAEQALGGDDQVEEVSLQGAASSGVLSIPEKGVDLDAASHGGSGGLSDAGSSRDSERYDSSGGAAGVVGGGSSGDVASGEPSGARRSVRVVSAPPTAVEVLRGEEERQGGDEDRRKANSGGLAKAFGGGGHELSIALIALLLLA